MTTSLGPLMVAPPQHRVRQSAAVDAAGRAVEPGPGFPRATLEPSSRLAPTGRALLTTRHKLSA